MYITKANQKIVPKLKAQLPKMIRENVVFSSAMGSPGYLVVSGMALDVLFFCIYMVLTDNPSYKGLLNEQELPHKLSESWEPLTPLEKTWISTHFRWHP